MHNYRGKRLKTHKKNYKQTGGNVIGTPEERAAANQTAQRLAAKYNLMDAPNMQIGEYLPQYVDPSGRPYQGTPQKALPTRVPAGIGLDQIQSEQGLYWYIDPQTGDPVDIDPTAVRDLQFRASQPKQQTDLAERSVALKTRNMQFNFRKGGRMQAGGIQDIRPAVNIEESIRDFYLANPEEEEQLNPLQEGIRKGLIQQPKNFGTAQEWYDTMNTPSSNQTIDQDWMTPLGIGLMGSRGVLSELSGRVARSRQNRYDALQQRLFNEQGEVNLNDYQPTAYSLYAKYGGQLKDYMPKFNNDADMRMDAQFGGMMMDNVRKIKYDRFGNPKKIKFHRGAPQSRQYFFPSLNDSYNPRNYFNPQMQGVPSGFHLMPDGTLMPNDQMYRKGGIHIKKENRGKFTEYCGGKVTDECIQKGLNSPSSTIRKRAVFAQNSRSWNK